MAKYIKKELLIKEATEDGAYDYVDARQINDMPTIDIVRCKDCRYFRKGWTKCKMLNLNGADGDWFCADGERRSK